MGRIDEYESIYWAAACLAFWAGCGVSDVQLSDAVNLTCDVARITVAQEAVLKETMSILMKGENDGAH